MNKYLQLATNQQDILYDQSIYPGSPLYNIGGSLIIFGSVNFELLNKAINHLITESDVFRITINKEQPNKQQLLKKIKFDLEYIDFSSHKTPKNQAQQWLENSFKKPFSLDKNELLWHFALIKESEKRYYLMTKYHHLIADGWSTTIVISRLAEIYNAFLNNQSIEKKSSQRYFKYIKEEQQYLNSTAFQVDSKYWATAMPKVPQTLISRRYPISSNNLLPKAHLHRFKIERNFYNEIIEFSSQNKSTSYQTILLVFAVYFSRVFQREEIIIGVPSLNRGGAQYKDVLGMFIRLSPLIIQITNTENTFQLLQKCKKRIKELYRHRRFPLGEISKRLKLLQNGRDTLFDIVLSYEKHDYSASYGNASISAIQQFSGVARFPLAVTICEFSDVSDVEIIFEGAENCFSEKDLKLLADRFLYILQQIIKQPQKTVQEIDVLADDDKQIIFDRFNQSNKQQKKSPSVVQLFQQQAKTQASKTAISFQNIETSYQQLELLSSTLAQHLVNQGVKANDVVAICLPNCAEMIVSILAILKASAAYLPIPADIPDHRIINILQQSRTELLITHSQYQERLSALHKNTLCADKYQFLANQSAKQLEKINIDPQSLAYVIFTSGSSGNPKGVMVEHSALSSRLNYLQSLFKITPKDRMGQTIHYFFDPSIIEIFLSLTQGACLVLIPESCYTEKNFANCIINQQITALALVPSSVRMLLNGLEESQQTSLRVACCGGERLEADLAKQFSQQTKAKLFNVYGSTETTIIASAWEYKDDFTGQMLPIGIPVDNTEIFIRDKHLHILPVNVLGEIVVSGNTLASGYINQPELSQKTFSISPGNQSKYYKSGDIGYIDYDGLLYFCGRDDRQVKISGYRTELGEIESVLQRHPKVTTAAVSIIESGQRKNIYAYVETKLKNTVSLIEELSLLLRQQLPNYMQPRAIISLLSIKTSLTGKVDYALLPKPDSIVKSKTINIPCNRLEAHLQKLWSQILSTEKIGIHENFFELGGDSLSAVSLMIAIEQLIGFRHPLSFLLENPCIADQALALDSMSSDTEPQLLITLSNQQNTTSLFIAASGHGDYLRFSNLANALQEISNVYMLQPSIIDNKHDSINTIAQHYADKIMQHGDDPFYISGFSIGGITALETARILVKQGTPPKGVILLDTIYPRWPIQSPTLFKLLKYLTGFFNLNRTILNNRRLEAMLNDTGIKVQLNGLPKHKIQGVDLPINLVLTKGMWMFQPLFFSSWSRLFNKQLTRHSISGLHGAMFQQPHLQQLIEIIRKIIA